MADNSNATRAQNISSTSNQGHGENVSENDFQVSPDGTLTPLRSSNHNPTDFTNFVKTESPNNLGYNPRPTYLKSENGFRQTVPYQSPGQSKKPPRDPNMPKKPMSAYFLFNRD